MCECECLWCYTWLRCVSNYLHVIMQSSIIHAFIHVSNAYISLWSFIWIFLFFTLLLLTFLMSVHTFVFFARRAQEKKWREIKKQQKKEWRMDGGKIKFLIFIRIILCIDASWAFSFSTHFSFLPSSFPVSHHLPCPLPSFISLLSLPLYSPPLNLSFWPLICFLTPSLPHSCLQGRVTTDLSFVFHIYFLLQRAITMLRAVRILLLKVLTNPVGKGEQLSLYPNNYVDFSEFQSTKKSNRFNA